jgi:hypothetical protein
MKIIIETETKNVFKAFDDNIEISMFEDRIDVLDQGQVVLIIVCNNVLNSFVVSDVILPAGWQPHKYKYINNSFQLNPDWVEPEVVDPPEPVLASEIT